MTMKQILLINDVVGCSHVGMVAMLPILTYLGHSAYNLPTALVSNTLDYGRFNVLETTDYMQGVLPVWKELGFKFDAVCTGLMFSEQQARLVSGYCKELSAQGVTIFVDPIMGDGGHLYNGMGPENIEQMREMVSVADLIFPNYTEACYLTDIPYKEEGMTWAEAEQMLDSLVQIGTRSAIITSAKVDGRHCVVGRRSKEPFAGFQQNISEGLYFCLPYEEIPVLFHGTGDIFSAVLIGHLLRGEALKASTHTAMKVVSQLIEHNKDLPDKMRGIPIEQCLDLL
ncbi:MAG: bifunctional hydroxymethylpyrimidine kinase/phosphomethylpyrimidine kinase [Prevotella sp.]|jgi:pyridoxine kinase|nr:bifunctional hydroxymethylpyrimidine kinase/phosphomethylpyrimidine kinase [Prevotella sp.]